jgi:hypothetical protein
MGRAGSVETPGAGGRKPLLKRLEGPSTMALGLIGALLIVVVVRRPWADIGGIRVKDNARIGYFLTHGATTSAGHEGDVVRPGDAVRFVYEASAASYLVILAAGAGGRVQVLYPDGPHAAHAPRGHDVALPRSTVLDDITGHERVVALFCAQPIEIEPVRRAWQATSGVGEPPIPPGCHADFTGWEKRAP